MPGKRDHGKRGHKDIARELTERIHSGQLKPLDKLPSRSELAADYGVSETTISRALGLLAYVGLVVGHQGKGVYVAYPEDDGAPAG